MSAAGVRRQLAPLCLGTLLVALDQGSKLLIAGFARHADLPLLGGLLRFRPILNENLSFLGNYVPFLRSPALMVGLNLLVLIVFVTGYGFYLSRIERPRPVPRLIYACGLAGCVCSLLDKLFWGGSLDFVQLPGLFTFDAKDCYLTVSLCLYLALFVCGRCRFQLREYFAYVFPSKRAGKAPTERKPEL